MRIKSILTEQQHQNAKYDPLINGVTSVVWEQFVDMYGKPINESVYATNVHNLKTLVLQTAMNMDARQSKRFLKTLSSPSNEVLMNGLNYRSKKDGIILESNTLYKAIFDGFEQLDEEYKAREQKDKNLLIRGMDAVEAAKKSAIGGTIGKVLKGVGDTVSKGVKAFTSTKIGGLIAQGIKAIATWVGEKLTAVAGFLAAKMQPIIDLLEKKGAEESALCGIPQVKPVKEALADDGFGNLVDTEKKPQITSGAYESSKLMTLVSDPANQTAIDSFAFSGAKPEATKVAKAIALMKGNGVVVKGENFKEILTTVGKIKPEGLMSQWYEDHNMADLIASAEGKPLPSLVAGEGGGFCDFSFDTMKSADGFMTKEMKNLSSPEFKDSWGKVMLKYAKKNKVSTFITLAGVVATLLMNPTGIVRIASMVFASVVPFIINARIEHLKSINAPDKQIYFWEDALTVSKFIATALAIFNIGTWVSRGWEGVTTDLDKIPTGADAAGIAADQAQLDSLLNKYPVGDGFKYSAGAEGTLAIYNDAGEQVFNGGIPLKTMDAETFAQMANNGQNIAPMSVGTGAQSGIEGAIKDGSDLVSFDKLDSIAQERFVNLVNGTGVTGAKSAAALETLQKAFNNPDIMDNMSNQQFTKIQDVLMHDMPGVDAELADNARAALIKRVLVDKTFTMDALNGLTPEKQEYFLEYMARNDGAIPKSVWGELTAAETAAKAAKAAAATQDGTLNPAIEPVDPNTVTGAPAGAAATEVASDGMVPTIKDMTDTATIDNIKSTMNSTVTIDRNNLDATYNALVAKQQAAGEMKRFAEAELAKIGKIGDEGYDALHAKYDAQVAAGIPNPKHPDDVIKGLQAQVVEADAARAAAKATGKLYDITSNGMGATNTAESLLGDRNVAAYKVPALSPYADPAVTQKIAEVKALKAELDTLMADKTLLNGNVADPAVAERLARVKTLTNDIQIRNDSVFSEMHTANAKAADQLIADLGSPKVVKTGGVLGFGEKDTYSETYKKTLRLFNTIEPSGAGGGKLMADVTEMSKSNPEAVKGILTKLFAGDLNPTDAGKALQALKTAAPAGVAT